MPIRKIVIWMSLVSFSFSYQWVGGQELSELTKRKEEVIKLLEASITNSIAIESGDVLWKEQVFFDSSDFENYNRPKKINPDEFQPGKVANSETWHRLFFDHKKKRFCYLRKTITHIQDFSDDVIKPVQQVTWTGLIDDQQNDKAFQLFGIGQLEELASSKNGKGPATYFQFPDVRVPPIAGKQTLKQRQNGLNGFKRLGKVKKIDNTENGYVTVIEWPSSEAFVGNSNIKEKTFDFSQTRFDVDSFQVVESKNWSEDLKGKRYPAFSTKYKWEERDGVFLPVVVSSSHATQLVIYGEPTLGQVETRNALHWFSVNQGVDHCKVFKGEAFQSLEDFERLVDPIKAKADSLIVSPPTEQEAGSDADSDSGSKKD